MTRVLGSSQSVPDREALPGWVAPIPEPIESLGLRLVWGVVATNLAGTAFGFWFYRHQFGETPLAMFPFVPDSPVATLLIATAFALWAIGRPNEYVTALAFFGNLIFGLWTPWVLLLFTDASIAQSGVLMHTFLVVSHLGMALQALVLHRIAAFRLRAVAVAAAWYTTNLTVDFFLPIVGTEPPSDFLPVRPHHTWIPVARDHVVAGVTTAFQLAALGAVLATVLAVFLALGLRVTKLEASGDECEAGAKRGLEKRVGRNDP
jgi:uncharacterized membrane protein YpjA